jgi:hypothetical protein
MRRTPVVVALLACCALLGGAPAAGQTPSLTPETPLTVEIADQGDTATATFEGTTGQRVSLEVTDVTIGTSACCSTKVSLVKPDGKVLVSLTLGTNGGFIDAATLPLTGTYSVVVDPSSTNTGSATLTLHDVPPDVSGSIEAGGASVGVALGTPGQNARLTFPGATGQRVSVEIAAVSIGTSICCSATVAILKPDGKTLASTSVGTNGGFLDAATLPAAGTYTILVDPQGTNFGSATLTLYDVPADAVGTIVAGGASETVATGTPGQNARVTFAGTAGQRVSLDVGPVCCTAKVSILRPDGKTLASTTVSPTGGFLDTTTLPSTGAYTILVDPMGAATGGFTLTLYDVPPDATGSIVPGGASTTLTTVTPGQNARATFDGTNGQRVSLAVGPTCCSTRVSILKPNGAVLVSPASMGTNGGFLDTATLPTTGTYTIVVDPQGASTGSVTLTLYDVPADVSGTIVAGGPAVTVTTDIPGQNARLSFAGTAGQRVSLKVGPTCCTTRVSILKPSGSTLVSTTFGTSGGFIDTTALPVSGTYTVVLDPQGGTTGSLTTTLYDVPADVSAPIVAGGAPATVATSTPGQNARLTFSGGAGQRVSLQLSDSCCTAQVSLLRPDGTTLASITTFGSGGFLDTTTLPSTGTYTILVDPLGSATGSMTLTLFDVPADVTGSIVAGGPTVRVTVSTPGQNARLTFTGTAGQRVSLELTNVTIGSSVGGTKVSILKPDGSTLVAPLSFGTAGGLVDATTLPATGTYTIVVDPQGANTGGATLALHDLPADVTASIVPGGAPVTLTIASPGQNAEVSFAGTAGQRVSLELGNVTIGSSSCCSTKVWIEHPDGSTLVAPIFIGTGGGFLDAVSLPDGGTYTIVVDPQSTSTGNATLTLYDVPADATAATTPGAPAVTVTTTTPGQNAAVTFAATVGQRVSLKVGPICCISRISILSPDGTTLVSPLSFGTGGGFVDTQVILVSGTYTVLVDPFGSAVGSTTLTLYDVPPDVTGTIEIGGSLRLTTTTPGQNAVATFAGTADDGIKLTVGPFNCCSIRVSILDPDGATVVPPTGLNPDGGALLMRLPVTGQYTIVVDPQGSSFGGVNLGLELDNTAPAPPTLTLSESAPDSHVVASTLFYRPGGTGGTFTVAALSTDGGAGLQKMRFPGLAEGFTPTSVFDDLGSPYTQTYSWTTGASYDNASNLVTAFDKIGNTSATPFAVKPDTAPPTTGDNTSAIGSAWKNTTQTVILSADDGAGAGSAITYYTTDGSAPTTSSAQGTAVSLATDGVYTVRYFSVDHVGNAEAVRTAGTAIRIDTTKPSSSTLDPLPTVIRNGQLLTGSGADALSGMGSITYLYCLGGACTPSTPIGSSSSGPSYAVTWSSQPADGTYQVVARAVDVAGNTLESAKRTVAIDNTAPNTTVTSGPANPTNATTATFGFTSSEAGSTFECRLDGAAFSSCTSPRSYSGLAAGSHTFEVRATDPVGNTDATPAVSTWTIDLTAPDTTITSGPASPTNATTATFGFTSGEAGSTFECRLDGSVFATCASPKSYSGLGAGDHTVEVRAVDPAGNIDPTPASYSWTVDLSAPETTIASGPGSPTNTTSASFTFSANEAGSTFDCQLDGGGFAACSSPTAYAGLASGVHTFEVRATDPAGNTDLTPATHSWTLDTGPPETTVTSAPNDPTNATSATFDFSSSESGSSFECALDGAAFTSCTSPRTHSTLSEGSHTFQVRATDAAGNTDPTPASRTWRVDLTPPDTTITSGPASPTNATTATFSFAASEAGSTFECALDGGPFAGCASPATYSDLAGGGHALEVLATDPAGNTDSTAATYAWTIDSTAPETTITSAPADPTNQTSAAFAFAADEAGSTFECELDGVGFTPCASPVSYSELTAGGHLFRVRATDPAGNADSTPATHAWTIDTTAPETTITAGPVDPTNSASASFSFVASEAGSTFECSLDGGPFAGCASPTTYPGMSDGSHAVEVRATDLAGNTDATPASYGWTVDSGAPETTIDASPADPTNETTATFSFTASEAGSTFECRLDGGAFAGCTSPRAYAGLGAGDHTFDVRATDAAGNTDPTPASRTWTIDLAAPDTTITSAPADPTSATSAEFGFASEPGSTFECRLDGAAYAPCTSPASYAGLGAGSHTFQVRATDAAGNTDSTAAAYTWVVDHTAPETAIFASPAAATSATSASFEFSANEAGSTFQCSLDGAVFGPCDSPKSYSGLAEGSHTFEVRATDTAGNTDATPASRTWTVDVTAPAAPVIESPGEGSTSNTGSFTISGSAEPGSTVEVYDGGASAGTTNASAGGTWSKGISGAADGSHTYTATASDAAGNVSGVSNARTVTVDTAAPNTTITTGPLGSTASTLASFTFGADDAAATFACQLDGGVWSPCTSPKSYSGLAEGSHTFQVRATDAAGNTDATPASRTWAVDVTAPAAPVIESPAEGSVSTTSSITVSGTAEAGSSVELFDGSVSKGFATAGAGGAWSKALSGVADGAHTYSAKASDNAGNVSPSSNTRTITVDTVKPETTIGSGPADPTSDTSATFEFAAGEAGASFECSLDGAPFAACSSPQTYSALAEGTHTFEVRAKDAAGNTDPTPASSSWTVDTTAPETTIDSGPADPTSDTSATFVFGAGETGSTFECRLDGGAFEPCSSPQTYTGLGAGSHTFDVRATDAAGNTDPTPAAHAWTVT